MDKQLASIAVTPGDDSLHEECGVFGVWSPQRADVAAMCYYGLYSLQHRGQEACGIVVNDKGLFRVGKDFGLVGEVFTREKLDKLGCGTIAVGHTRYGTTGLNTRDNIQPLVVNHHKGHMAIAHNGNLANASELRSLMEQRGAIFHTTSDTEVIAYTIIQERLQCSSIEEAASRAMERLEGAYSLVMTSPAKLIALRDPKGIRPLCMGQTKSGAYVFASESCSLQAVGATLVRDVEPGEIVIVSREGVRSRREHCGQVKKALCVFEHIYFARPDSIIDGCSVHAARRRAGAFLAKADPVEADIVIGVPDSGLDAALGYAEQSGVPYGMGFIKNKYIGRTFIAPTQAMREDGVRIKLSPMSAVVAGKRVVMVDDSIVRGTTSRRIVGQLREAGATEVHLRICSPPFRHPCYYGTDIDSEENLLATHHTLAEMTELVGADSLAFLSMEDVVKLTGNEQEGFCLGCFNGEYPTRVEVGGKDAFEQEIDN